MPGPYLFVTTDWAGRGVALEERQWNNHIRRNRGWSAEMIPLVRQTVTDPDAVYESERDSKRTEVWRQFDDVKDGQPGILKVIIEYNASIGVATSGDVVTAMVALAVNSRGTQLWTRD